MVPIILVVVLTLVLVLTPILLILINDTLVKQSQQSWLECLQLVQRVARSQLKGADVCGVERVSEGILRVGMQVAHRQQRYLEIEDKGQRVVALGLVHGGLADPRAASAKPEA